MAVMAYVLSLIVGLAVGIGIVALLFRKKVLDMTFDERQERARGKAYRYGFFTLLGCLLVYGATDLVFGRWCDVLAGCVICVCVSITVFGAVCILNDAYLSLREQPRKVMTVFALAAAFNLVLGGVNVLKGGVVENGVLTFRAINPICGVTMVVLMGLYIVNHLLREREAE